MQNFTYNMPTTAHFGRNAIENLPEIVSRKRILLVSGCGSIKKIGLYDQLKTLLAQAGAEWTELSGVLPNPRITSVREGVARCRQNDVELVLAAGGGSVIDCAKAIAAARYYDGDAWDIVKYPKKIENVLPVCAVLTLSATGSELNGHFVISNEQTVEKVGAWNQRSYPKYSILDPEYTFSVSAYQTAAGAADIFSHAMEGYFNPEWNCAVTDHLSEGVMRTCLQYGRMAIDHPECYEARANLMWAGSLGMTGISRYGRRTDFITSCHPIEHQLSAYYDVNHGMGLGVLMPAWMDYVLSDATVDRFIQYGANVFGISAILPKMQIARTAIECTRAFLRDMGVPATLRELGITEERHFADMAQKAVAAGLEKAFVPLDERDVINILHSCM